MKKNKSVDLTTSLAGVRLENPTVLASGFLGVSSSSLIRVSESGAGAVTTKSIGLEERKGHPNPVVVEYSGGLLNAVGLSTPGIDESVVELRKTLKNIKVPVIASIYGRKVSEYGRLSEIISKVKPHMIEANISCPNVEDEFGKPFATDPKVAGKVVKEIKSYSGRIPLFVKLTPNVPDIKPIAKAVVDAGADGITAINTVGPGMAIDIRARKPVLSNKTGGLSGPAIKPVAVRCVYDITSVVDVPVIGVGGILSGEDAVELMMAGASAVGIGTGIMYRGMDVFRKVCGEVRDFMVEGGYSRLDEIIGKAQ